MSSNVDVLVVDNRTLDADATMYAVKRVRPFAKMLRLKSGEEALQYLFSAGTSSGRRRAMPSLAFIALEMPTMNGICVLELMRAHPLTTEITVVIQCTERFLRKHRRNDQFAADAYVTKQWDLARYCTVIGALAGEHLSPCLRTPLLDASGSLLKVSYIR